MNVKRETRRAARWSRGRESVCFPVLLCFSVSVPLFHALCASCLADFHLFRERERERDACFPILLCFSVFCPSFLALRSSSLADVHLFTILFLTFLVTVFFRCEIKTYRLREREREECVLPCSPLLLRVCYICVCVHEYLLSFLSFSFCLSLSPAFLTPPLSLLSPSLSL